MNGVVIKSLCITSHASIFTAAELVVLNLALDTIRLSRHKKFVIISDSLSGLVAIHNFHLETGYVQKFIQNYCKRWDVYCPYLDIRSHWCQRSELLGVSDGCSLTDASGVDSTAAITDAASRSSSLTEAGAKSSS